MTNESRNPDVHLEAIGRTIGTINTEEELNEIRVRLDSLRRLVRSPGVDFEETTGRYGELPAIAYFAGHLSSFEVTGEVLGGLYDVDLHFEVEGNVIQEWKIHA